MGWRQLKSTRIRWGFKAIFEVYIRETERHVVYTVNLVQIEIGGEKKRKFRQLCYLSMQEGGSKGIIKSRHYIQLSLMGRLLR